jgi:rRNA maturation protein Rpf1
MLPDSEKFNRGGMSLGELVSRINTSGASVCLVTSLYKGNPGSIQFIDPSGTTILSMKIESALLRREIDSGSTIRTSALRAIVVDPEHNESVKELAEVLSSLLGIEIAELDSDKQIGKHDKNQVEIRLLSHGQSRLTWTFHKTTSSTEIGPRIRARSVERNAQLMR